MAEKKNQQAWPQAPAHCHGDEKRDGPYENKYFDILRNMLVHFLAVRQYDSYCSTRYRKEMVSLALNKRLKTEGYRQPSSVQSSPNPPTSSLMNTFYRVCTKTKV